MNRALQHQSMWVIVMAVGLTVLCGPSLAASNGITYQGTLVEPSGNIATDGVYSLYFSVWDALAGGNKLWEETNLMVTVTKGAFAVELGLKTAFGTIFDDGASRWLEIAVDFTGTGEQAFTPRVPFSMVPFARKAAKAGDADTLDGNQASSFATSEHSHTLSGLSGSVTDAQVPDNITVIHAGSAATATNATTATTATNATNATNATFANNADTVDGSHASSFATSAHSHALPSLSGSVTDAQVPDNITIGYAAAAGTATSAGTASNATNADTVDGQHAAAFSLTAHGHALSALSGAVTDAQVPNNITVDLATSATNATTATNADTLDFYHADNFWKTMGNSGTIDGNDFIGTRDNVALEFRVNYVRALRIEPKSLSPNIIAGSNANGVISGVMGAIISGGGALGSPNYVGDDFGVVVGGQNNMAGDGAGSVGDNAYATVGGGYSNTASGANSTVGGGNNNYAGEDQATIGGGYFNSVSGAYATVGGGRNNDAQAMYATIAGGGPSDNGNPTTTNNRVTDDFGTVAGGGGNVAGDGSGTKSDMPGAAVGGGIRNTASASYATVGGGYLNYATNNSATVGGGLYNSAAHIYATVSGGTNNTAGGAYSAIPGGCNNTTEGAYSFAAGYAAKALYNGCFVWVDSTGEATDSTDPNQFRVRSTGGVWFYSGAGDTGVTLAPGSGAWTDLSDRNAKENLAPVDVSQVLDKVAALPITTWNYKSQDKSIRHVGPMAQDMHAAFKVGETDKGISTVDASGVALAAIQGLNQRLKEGMNEKDREIARLRAEMNELKALVNTMAAK